MNATLEIFAANVAKSFILIIKMMLVDGYFMFQVEKKIKKLIDM